MTIFLSPPDVRGPEAEFLLAALASGWIAPQGPDVEAFECEVAGSVGVSHAVAVSSGTAGLHVLLRCLGVGTGDSVLVSTFTFVACANAITYLGATPVFIDSEAESWNMSPGLLYEELESRARVGKLPKAVIVADTYGQCADYGAISAALAHYEVPLVEDAAEALGASRFGIPAGSFGSGSVISFNGNKIVTTGGGGMVLTEDQELAERVLKLATQAREPAMHYEHTEIGYNYRLSNLSAALGRAQLCSLEDRIRRKAHLRERYRAALQPYSDISLMPVPSDSLPNYWLTCLTRASSTDNCEAWLSDLLATFAAARVEARPLWKPLHRQPVYRGAPRRCDGTADSLFQRGICLPSGSGMTDAQQDIVIEIFLTFLDSL
jgi:pyridoxal phosphate-dependent aminotransferase EpsN